MFYYEGLACPVCSKAFTTDDDVVVCPQCGLPHHRACWKSVGKCFEEERHGTDQQWSRERSRTTTADSAFANSAAQVCPRCGTQNTEYAEFCTRCGHSLDAKEWHSAPPQHTPFYGEYSPFGQPYESYSSQEPIGKANAADLAAVIGNNTGYYMERFRRIAHGGRGGWNWSAFLLGPVWLFYRKQYGLGTLYLVMQLLVSVASTIAYAPINSLTVTEQMVEELMQDPMFLLAAALSYIVLALRILLGIRANHFYLQHCERKIEKARKNTSNISVSELSAVGGVSAGATAAVAVLLYTVFPILLEAILGLMK